jgi:hypothetical protein
VSADHAAEHQSVPAKAAGPANVAAPVAAQPAPETWQLLQQSIGNRALGRLIEGRDDSMSTRRTDDYTRPGPAQEAGQAAARRRGLGLEMLMGLQGTMGNSFVGRLLHHVSEADAPAVGTSGRIDSSTGPVGEALPRLDDEEPAAAAPADPANATPGGPDDDDDPDIPKSGTVEPISGALEDRPEAADDETGGPLQIVSNFKITPIQAGINHLNAPMGMSRADTVTSSISLKSSIQTGGIDVPATSFGHEEPTYSLGTTNWTRNKKVITVDCEIKIDCHYAINSQGRKNVGSANDDIVTEKTWNKISKDLMPEDDGKAPRTEYFAQDLTQLHEQFHGWDDIGQAERFVPTAKTYLDQQTIDPKGDISAQMAALLENVRGQFAADGNMHYMNGGEARAYADGKMAYEDRANSVRMRGIKEKWRP